MGVAVSNVVALLSHRANIHIQANNGKSALEIARAKGNVEIAELLADAYRVNVDFLPR